MFLYMYIAPGKGQIIHADKILHRNKAAVASIMKFHPDIPISKENVRLETIFKLSELILRWYCEVLL